MAKAKGMSKTNVTARAANKADAAPCKICGNKVEVVLRVPREGGRKYMARVCCERAGIAG